MPAFQNKCPTHMASDSIADIRSCILHSSLLCAGAIGNVASQHKFAGSAEEASEFCLKAGCDWNCGEKIIIRTIKHTGSILASGCIELIINTCT